MTEPVSGWCAARRARTCERGSVKVNDLYALLYASEILVPATAPDEALMALTKLTKRWFAHCGRKRRV